VRPSLFIPSGIVLFLWLFVEVFYISVTESLLKGVSGEVYQNVVNSGQYQHLQGKVFGDVPFDIFLKLVSTISLFLYLPIVIRLKCLQGKFEFMDCSRIFGGTTSDSLDISTQRSHLFSLKEIRYERIMFGFQFLFSILVSFAGSIIDTSISLHLLLVATVFITISSILSQPFINININHIVIGALFATMSSLLLSQSVLLNDIGSSTILSDYIFKFHQRIDPIYILSISFCLPIILYQFFQQKGGRLTNLKNYNKNGNENKDGERNTFKGSQSNNNSFVPYLSLLQTGDMKASKIALQKLIGASRVESQRQELMEQNSLSILEEFMVFCFDQEKEILDLDSPSSPFLVFRSLIFRSWYIIFQVDLKEYLTDLIRCEQDALSIISNLFITKSPKPKFSNQTIQICLSSICGDNNEVISDQERVKAPLRMRKNWNAKLCLIAIQTIINASDEKDDKTKLQIVNAGVLHALVPLLKQAGRDVEEYVKKTKNVENEERDKYIDYAVNRGCRLVSRVSFSNKLKPNIKLDIVDIPYLVSSLVSLASVPSWEPSPLTDTFLCCYLCLDSPYVRFTICFSN